MKITQKHLSLGKLARGGEYGKDTAGKTIIINTHKPWEFDKPPVRIIIHWIGPYPGQAVSTPWNWWENGSDGGGVRASAHFIVKDADVIQCLPLNEVGWHAGDSRNFDSIGIEVIPMNIEGEFSKLSIDTLKLVIQHIRNEIGNNLKLERHFDGVQEKDCPRFYTPLSDMVTREEQYNHVPMQGQERWEKLKLFLNDWKPE
ncbi:MAG: peptidoglycan recognition protein family protein [Treponema sp.]|jgi:hypothetical protein|nr:peptidoglycan recognition protein family protein [Treponema sp.]